MDTERARELLPWLLNGSLEEPERQELLAALRGSEELRRELAATRLAGEVFGQHVPTADLVAHAFGAPAGLDRARIEAHVALCARCAEELALARESRALAGEAEGVAAPAAAPAREERRRGRLLAFLRPAAASGGGRAAGGGWRTAALAASVAALVGLGGWIWSWQQEQGRIAELAAALGEASPPHPGQEVGQTGLIPDVLRSGDAVGCEGRANCLELDARRGRATLHILREPEPGIEYVLELRPRDGAGEEAIRVRPVAATPGSQLEFWADAGRLEAGEYDAALYRLDDRGWERIESYPLTVVHSGR